MARIKMLKAAQFAVLVKVNEATLQGNGGLVGPADVKAFSDFMAQEGAPKILEFANMPPDINGAIPARTTPIGQTYVSDRLAKEAAKEAAPPRVAPEFEIEEASELPDAPARGRREPSLPFMTVPAPHKIKTKEGEKTVYPSFFVKCPDGEDLAKFRKRLTATVASASKRYSVHATDPRTYTTREATKDGHDGIRVYRTA